MRFFKRFWYIWVKAIGEKGHVDNSTSDAIAVLRTLIVLCYIITNIFIVAGVIKHWNS